jgi:hypothetical protein
MADVRTPKWQQEVAFRVALEVVELARRHRELDSRLNGAVEALTADADELRKAISATLSTRAEQRSATARQRRTARRACRKVSAFRRAMRWARPNDRALHRRIGVGVRLDVGKVGSVAAALQTALDAAAQLPEAVEEAGVTPEDLEALRLTLDALLSADASQEASKVGAKQATAQRDEVQLRVEAAVGKVLAAAALVFHDRPAIAAAFAAVVPGEGNGKVKASAGTEADRPPGGEQQPPGGEQQPPGTEQSATA